MIIKIQKGFTLIELMITVAIVGILAAVAFASYPNYLIKAQISEGIILMASLKQPITESYTIKGSLDEVLENNAAALSLKLPKGKYGSVWSIQDNKIMMYMNGDEVHEKLRNQWLILEPEETNTGNLKWTCGGWYTLKEYMPSTCNHNFNLY